MLSIVCCLEHTYGFLHCCNSSYCLLTRIEIEVIRSMLSVDPLFIQSFIFYWKCHLIHFSYVYFYLCSFIYHSPSCHVFLIIYFWRIRYSRRPLHKDLDNLAIELVSMFVSRECYSFQWGRTLMQVTTESLLLHISFPNYLHYTYYLILLMPYTYLH